MTGGDVDISCIPVFLYSRIPYGSKFALGESKDWSRPGEKKKKKKMRGGGCGRWRTMDAENESWDLVSRDLAHFRFTCLARNGLDGSPYC